MRDVACLTALLSQLSSDAQKALNEYLITGGPTSLLDTRTRAAKRQLGPGWAACDGAGRPQDAASGTSSALLQPRLQAHATQVPNL